MPSGLALRVFFREISESPRLKFASAWMTVGVLVFPLAVMVTLGLSEKIAGLLLVATILPVQYLASCFLRDPVRKANSAASRPLDLGAHEVRSRSVKDDWQASLPENKSRLFSSVAQTLEARYTSLSISVNEALELRPAGRLAAHQICATLGDSSMQLTYPLDFVLRALAEHVKRYGTMPLSAPLDPANFQGLKEQRSARLSGLLYHVLLSHRIQFLHKIGTLQEMVEDLSHDFCDATTHLANGTSTEPATLWQSIDAAHYDLNTCLRETIILLKSFLLVLPEEQVDAFRPVLRFFTAIPSSVNQSLQPSLGIASSGQSKRRPYVTYEDLAGVGKPS